MTGRAGRWLARLGRGLWWFGAAFAAGLAIWALFFQPGGPQGTLLAVAAAALLGGAVLRRLFGG